MSMQTPHRIATDARQNLEAWCLWDESAEVYEVFASEECNDYIGCADTRFEAIKVARYWFAEQAENSL
jgi:hypothetical protein